KGGTKMRRVLVLGLLALALPIAAWANTISFTNQNGGLNISGMAGTGGGGGVGGLNNTSIWSPSGNGGAGDDRRINHHFDWIAADDLGLHRSYFWTLSWYGEFHDRCPGHRLHSVWGDF